MRFTNSLIKTTRDPSKDEESKNAQLLIRAGFVDKLMAGVYTFLPLGLRVLQKTQTLVRKHMDIHGGIEVLMPSLQPKGIYEQTQRWDSMDSLVRFITHWTKSEYALGATHEEVVTPLLQKFVHSYKDLPKAVYQIQNKFRDEKRAKSGLLRGKEFLMKDLYSFHTDQADLDRYYEIQTEAYKQIFAEAGIGDKTYMTYASGGAFSKYSHEFQTLCDAGEDIIYICRSCHIAINREIITEQNSCPQCHNPELIEDKGIEVGNIFKLQTKFSDAFGLTYTNSEGKPMPVVMGCYGIGISRLIGTVAELLSDDTGLVWPRSLAPFTVHLVVLNSDDQNILDQANQVYELLTDNQIEVLYDDRRGVSIGEKFADADLIGCPLRVTISKRTFEKAVFELKGRTSKDSSTHPLSDIISVIQNHS
ncbi:prolyl-tRNA synthetase [Candidatus Gracilibacteria bacterium]|nr:prolyl-tRNA synthetase [Candidatus Gracilibacteria bacterium]